MTDYHYFSSLLHVGFWTAVSDTRPLPLLCGTLVLRVGYFIPFSWWFSFFVLCVQTLVLCEPCCFLYCHCFAAKYSFCVRLKHEKTNNRCGRLGVHMAQEQICFLCRAVFLYYLAYSTLSQHSAKSARASVLWWDGLSYWFIGMPQNLMQPESDATVYYGSSNLQSACGHSQNALTLGSRSLCIQSLS